MINLDSTTVYIARSIVQLLDGNVNEFNRYKELALEAYKEERYQETAVFTIGEMIPLETKNRLRLLV